MFAGRNIPYYSSSGTVTLSRPGTTTMIRPLSGGLEPLDRPYQPTEAPRSVSFSQYPMAPRSMRFSPLAMTRQELEEAIATEIPEQSPMVLTNRQELSLLLKQQADQTP